jgi:hypothetical protein
MSAPDLRTELTRLTAERLDAREAGLDCVASYAAHLDTEIASLEAAYVGLAVTEIATLRGELSGRLQG